MAKNDILESTIPRPPTNYLAGEAKRYLASALELASNPADDVLISIMLEHIEFLKSTEQVFGTALALTKHGRVFPGGVNSIPLTRGEPGACFRNATLHAMTRDDAVYAEGYAIDPKLQIPIHHAWLVGTSGNVIDPTWSDSEKCVYFGIPFSTAFVADIMPRCGNEPGILVNLHLLRKNFPAPGQLERALALGIAH